MGVEICIGVLHIFFCVTLNLQIYAEDITTVETLKSNQFSISDDEIDDLASSTSGSTHAILTNNQRRSEPDLTKLAVHQLKTDTKLTNVVQLVETGAYPNDLDLIQGAIHNGVPLASSCPDLSEAQKVFFGEFWVSVIVHCRLLLPGHITT